MDNEKWVLTLYVIGATPAAKRALANLTAICQEHLSGEYVIDVVDLAEDPNLAETHQIFAVPTLVRRVPEPQRQVIGDLSNRSRVLAGMDLHPPE